MFTKVNVGQPTYIQATGRRISELVSAAKNNAVGVTCRVVEIMPEEEGGSRQPHTHTDMEEVIFVLEGKGKVWVEEREEEITKDDLIVVPMQLSHRIINPGGTLKLLCIFPKAVVEIP